MSSHNISRLPISQRTLKTDTITLQFLPYTKAGKTVIYVSNDGKEMIIWLVAHETDGLF